MRMSGPCSPWQNLMNSKLLATVVGNAKLNNVAAFANARQVVFSPFV